MDWYKDRSTIWSGDEGIRVNQTYIATGSR